MNEGNHSLSSYKGILNYEKAGNAKLFSLYALPPDCDTILFPGCTFPGNSPEATWLLVKNLQLSFPHMGVVLDCCNKPSYDLGRSIYSMGKKSALLQRLADHGVTRILVACPNCHKMLCDNEYNIKVETVYEHVSITSDAKQYRKNTVVTVHDPCPLRFVPKAHIAVRRLLKAHGITVVEMQHSKEHTLCCGEGGNVENVAPENSSAWLTKRQNEAHEHDIVSYCAGCVRRIGSRAPTQHILDIVFNLSRKRPPSVLTYINRIRLKRRLKRMFFTQ